MKKPAMPLLLPVLLIGCSQTMPYLPTETDMNGREDVGTETGMINALDEEDTQTEHGRRDTAPGFVDTQVFGEIATDTVTESASDVSDTDAVEDSEDDVDTDAAYDTTESETEHPVDPPPPVGCDDVVCHDNAFCEIQNRAPVCICEPGYDGDGETCEDIDECALGLHDCAKDDRTCVNTPGGYECDCEGNRMITFSGLCADIVACNDYRFTAIYKMRGSVADVVVENGMAYLAHGRDGLAVYDVSGPGTAVFSNFVDTGGVAVAVAAQSGYVYVLNERMGLKVVDITDAAAPRVVGGSVSIDSGSDLSVSGNLAFVLSPEGLWVLDISESTAPKLLGTVNEIRRGTVVHAVGSRVYVGESGKGVLVVDASDPSGPVVEKTIPISNGSCGSYGVRDLFADERLIYATNGQFFYVLDAAAPVESAIVSRLELQSDASRVQVAGDRAYLTTSEYLATVDISDPRNPRNTALYPLDGGRYARNDALWIENGMAYVVAEGSGMWIVDLSGQDSAAMPIPRITDTEFSFCRAMDLIGDHLFVAWGQSELMVVDVTDQAHPVIVAELPIPGIIDMVLTAGDDRAYVLTEHSGLYIVDVSSPEHPELLRTVEMAPEGAHSLAIDGGKALVAFSNDDEDALRIVDLSDPAVPVQIAPQLAESLGETSEMVASEGYVYLAANKEGESQIIVLDVSDAAEPRSIASLATAEDIGQLLVSETRLYALGRDAFYSIDISAPEAPTLMATLALQVYWSGSYRPMSQSENLLYIEDQYIIDVADPSHPLLVEYELPDTVLGIQSVLVSGGRIFWGGSALYMGNVLPGQAPVWSAELRDSYIRDMALREGYAYLVGGSGILEVYDVTDAASPFRANRVAVPEDVWDMDRYGDKLYLACRENGLQIVDISDPGKPVLRGRTDTAPGEEACDARVVHATGTHAVVGDDKGGLVVVNVTDPDAPFVKSTVGGIQSINDIDSSGDLLYVTTNHSSSGLYILDVSNPSEPDVLYDEYLDFASQVAVQGDYAYLNVNDNLMVLNVSSSEAPVIEWLVPSLARDMIVAGQRLFGLGERLDVFDISNPAEPVLWESLPCPVGSCENAQIDGETGYLMSGSTLVTVDIAAMARPLPVTQAISSSTARRLVKEGDRLMVLDSRGLKVVDVTRPEAPQELGRLELPSPESLHVSDGKAYVGTYDSGIWIADIASSQAPRITGAIYTGDQSDCVFQTRNGDIGYVLSDSHLMAYDLSSPMSPKELGRLALDAPEEMVLLGDRAYVASGDTGLTVVDLSDVSNPTALGTVSAEGTLTHLTADKERLYATAKDDERFLVFDLDDPDEPALAASLPIPRNGPVFVEGHTAYVSAGSKGLLLIDITDPSHPVERGNVYGDSEVVDADVDGPLAYLVDRSGGLHIVDISAYSHPPLAVTTLAAQSVSRLAEKDGRLYAVSDKTEIDIFDMTAEVKALRVGDLRTSDEIRDMVIGDYLFYGTAQGEVLVADPSVPGSPGIVAAIDFVSDGSLDLLRLNGHTLVAFASGCDFWTVDVADPATAQAKEPYQLPGCGYSLKDMWAWDHYLAAITPTDMYGDGGALVVVDIQDPEAPVELVVEPISSPTTITAASGRYLYVGTRRNGLSVWDLSNPENPAQAGVIEIPGEVTDLHIEGETLLVAQGAGGISAFPIGDPSNTTPITAVTLPGGAFEIVSDGERVFATSDTGELRAVDMLMCRELRESI